MMVQEKINEDKEIDKLTSINGTVHKVKVINPTSFRIKDTSKYGKYLRNGIAK